MDRVTGRLQPMGVAKSQTRLSNLAGSYLRVDFLGGSDGKKCACNAGDLGSIPGLGRSPGEGNGNPLLCSCLGNPMDRGAWWAVGLLTDTTE